MLPRVRVDNLASKALALALRGLAERWEANHGCRPVLCETFIDPTRFDGACHKAANWETIGMTAGKRSGRGAKPAKEILVRPLDPEFRAVLKGETTPGPRPKRRSPAAFDHGFAAMWSRIADAAADIAARRDETWIKRRRTLNTLIIMLFVFRLALSRGRKGYTTVTAELWDQCRRLGGAHYPQGLLSCLYRLDSRMPADFTLTSGADERAAARAHLGALSPGDVVVFDRGYFSFVLLRDMTARGLHPVFRIQRNSAAGFDRFRDGDRDDALVRITPGKNALRRLKAAGIPEPSSPIVLRLVRYDIGESRYVLATTLADTERYSRKDLSELYHGRWGIEELFKISKTTLAVEEFHGRSERGVRQELYAHFNLIAMARLFTNRGDAALDEAHEGDLPKMRTNFTNALAMLAGSLEELILTQTSALADAVSRVANSVLAARARLRPGRSFPRRSQKPVGKWQRRRHQTA